MCVTFDQTPIVLTEDRWMFKWAPFGRSVYDPEARSQIDGWGNLDRGMVLKYEVGEKVKSPRGPGIMGYAKRPRHPSPAWLEMRIPAGATVYEGYEDKAAVLAASEVVVIARMRGIE